MKNILKTATLLFLLISVISCNSEDSMDDDSNNPNATIENEILELVNTYRSSKNLTTLKKLEAIKTQTDIHTDYMIQKNAISHDLFDDRWEYLKENVDAKRIAENVAAGYSTPKAVVDGWIKSDGHRKNIEGNYTHFHVTAKQNSENVWYYTNIFINK